MRKRKLAKETRAAGAPRTHLSTFSDESLRVIIEKSSSPAMVEAAKAVMDKRRVPFPALT
jgi:hypothetical protein